MSYSPYTISQKQTGTWVTLLVVIAASFIVEWAYQRYTKEHFRLNPARGATKDPA